MGFAPDPVLDEGVLAELKQRQDPAAFASHIDAAARRIEALLALLDDPDAAENESLRDSVHDLVGVSGLMGLTELSARLRRFDSAADRGPAVSPLREAAIEAARALRRQQEPAWAARR
jgi:hypothetical protein